VHSAAHTPDLAEAVAGAEEEEEEVVVVVAVDHKAALDRPNTARPYETNTSPSAFWKTTTCDPYSALSHLPALPPRVEH